MYQQKTLLIVSNVDFIFILHRMAMAERAMKSGYRVVVIAKDTGRAKEITDKGFQYYNLNISRAGTNPFTEIKTIYTLAKLYKKINPDIIYQVTMKPVIYGTIISKIFGFKTVNAISGLGYNFTENRRGLVQKIMTFLMKWGFHKSNNHLIFENRDDFAELDKANIITTANKVSFVKGVGVDLTKFKNQEVANQDKITILLPTRMLWDKGVKEFVEAALILKNHYFTKVQFVLCGMLDDEYREAVPVSYLLAHEIPNYLQWIGHQDDMVSIYKSADIVVLPSYREGMPTVLLEACAMGKPIVTTDAIGCRECVEEGKNGYQVPVKSVVALADVIKKLINSPEDRTRMGQYSRQKAEKEFDQEVVIQKHLEIFDALVNVKLLKKGN